MTAYHDLMSLLISQCDDSYDFRSVPATTASRPNMPFLRLSVPSHVFFV